MMLHLGREGKVVSEDGNFLSREDDSCQFSPSPDCSKSPKIQQLHTVVSEYTTRVSLSFSEVITCTIYTSVPDTVFLDGRHGDDRKAQRVWRATDHRYINWNSKIFGRV
ncbi:hypothetical protein KCU87_g379, partial [Aureobasidium melanogenum]